MGIDRKFARSRLPIDTASVLKKLQNIREQREAKLTKASRPDVSAVAGTKANENVDVNEITAITPAPATAAPAPVVVGKFGFPKTLETSGLAPIGFQPDASQLAAVNKLKSSHRGCLIGAAGTGKTTIMKYLVAKLMFPDDGTEPVIRSINDIEFCSFTGTAAHVIKKSLPEWLRAKCGTIHSLLEYAPNDGASDDPRYFIPRRDMFNKLTCKVLFIDETSMVSTQLWDEIQAALPYNARVIAVGDLNQLPPYGGSSAFGFMLSEFNVAELKTIHRQSSDAAQIIIEGAHNILRGNEVEFQLPDKEGDWACTNFTLNSNSNIAAKEVVSILSHLSKVVTPGGDRIYDPHRDRVITAGNGWEPDSKGAGIQQYSLNCALAPYFDPPTEEHPEILINAGFQDSEKVLAVGFRVMAKKNESPAIKDRVTNGMLGRVVEIRRNLAWDGDWALVGKLNEVKAEKRKRISASLHRRADKSDTAIARKAKLDIEGEIKELKALSISDDKWRQIVEQTKLNDENQRMAGPASHTVVVEFENGKRRDMVSQAQVSSLQLAYVTTVGTAQGSQHETVIIICHDAVKFQLSREFLYTAWTRASRRVILLSTEYGLRYALAKQRIKGDTLEEKIQRYRAFLENKGEVA